MTRIPRSAVFSTITPLTGDRNVMVSAAWPLCCDLVDLGVRHVEPRQTFTRRRGEPVRVFGQPARVCRMAAVDRPRSASR